MLIVCNKHCFTGGLANDILQNALEQVSSKSDDLRELAVDELGNVIKIETQPQGLSIEEVIAENSEFLSQLLK